MWQYNRFKKRKKKEVNPIEQKPKVKREPDYADQLDRVFSLYIRCRDAMPGGMTRCISCGQIKPFDKFDAGHYYSRSHIGTRWDEDNVNAECNFCNRMSGGEHMIGYRENLIKKIGMQRFQLLEVKAHSYSDLKKDPFKLKLLIDDYKKKTALLIKQKGIPR